MLGAELYVSEKTVENHVRNILHKLHLTRRDELRRWGADHGIRYAMTGDRLLSEQWTPLVPAGQEADALGVDLLARWGEPHRRYHNVDHLRAVLSHLDRLGPASRAARLGAWYHDAVYQPGHLDNEEASAFLARSSLEAIRVDANLVGEVVRLVHLTASHRADPDDADGAQLCDADLAVLGSTPAAYEAYRRAVREEYATVDADGWRRGRSQVVEEFLNRDHIFATPIGFRLWEAPARVNLRRELNELRL